MKPDTRFEPDREGANPDTDRHDRDDKHEGDVLGVSEARGNIPRATEDRSGNPAGIDVRERTTGTGDLSRGKGATGIDMGAHGEDTEVDRKGRP